MTPLFIGVDLGGSGTRAALVEADGRMIALGQGPTGLVGRPTARQRMGRALDAALAPIRGLVADRECTVFAGTRGLSVPGRRERLLVELRERLPSAEVRVSNDALIAAWGGLARPEGVAVVAGAGSIALALSADGRSGRAGGWGYLLGDDGSGYWLGREALLLHLRTLEGRGSPGELTRLVSEAVASSTVVETLGWLYRGEDQVNRLAQMAPLVSQAAAAGDCAAAQILERAGAALAEIAAAAARQVLTSAGAGLDVATCGGVWSAGTSLLDAFDAALARSMPGAVRVSPRLPPVGGAVLLAMGADRAPLAPEVADRLCASL